MANKVDFFTPVQYSRRTTSEHYIEEGIENYFYLWG